MNRRTWRLIWGGLFVAAVCAAFVRWQFGRDLASATAHAAQGGKLLMTRCGPIEAQQAGAGRALLMVHGSGGGHDQGMDWARPLTREGMRVIAMSRFGYLRTPRPADASPEAQADAHVCLLDALGIGKAAVVGVSAGAASALQIALRHPGRISALVLVVPIAWKPGSVVDSAPPVSDDKDAWLLRLLGSDFLYWTGLRVARDPVFRHVLATPPELIHAASPQEQARVNAMAERVLPVSQRAPGLRDDTRLGKRLGPAALETIQVPTLVISARDDGFGTYAGAEYTASRIRVPGSSATTTAGTCWWATTRRCATPSSDGCDRQTRNEERAVVVWIKRVAVVTAVLLTVFAFLAAFGAWRWNAGTRGLMDRLEAARRDAPPSRFDAERDLAGLRLQCSGSSGLHWPTEPPSSPRRAWSIEARSIWRPRGRTDGSPSRRHNASRRDGRASSGTPAWRWRRASRCACTTPMSRARASCIPPCWG